MSQIIKVQSAQFWTAYMVIRHRVFCVEKDVPEDIQIDEYDTLDGVAEHFLICRDDVPMGAFRCRPEGNVIHLQRFCVLKPYRKQGLGRAMLDFARDYYRKKGYEKMVMTAKFSAQPFYEKCGCVTVSDVFMEVGLPHVKMEMHFSEKG